MDVAALRKLAEKATPGPWAVKKGTATLRIDDEIHEAFMLSAGDRASAWFVLEGDDDLAYIAAVSPEVVLALCDVAEAARHHVALYPAWHDNALRSAVKTLARHEELPLSPEKEKEASDV